jgi:hypothetical protein
VDYQDIVHLVNTDPAAQALLAAPIPMRLAYVGLDGHPRTVPVAYLWDGKAFVFATETTSYKVRALAGHPEVAFTVDTNAPDTRAMITPALGPPVADFLPMILMVRGRASIEVKPGVPQEHVNASRRLVGDDEKWREWERIKREATAEMAVVTIIPTHVTVCDFVTRFPPPSEIEAVAHGAK